jgi:hypothetical protein
MAQRTTGIQTAKDVVEFLTDQHEQVKELLPTVLDGSGDERSKAFAEVRRYLALHETIEQTVIHPKAKKDVSSDVVDERISEEEEATDAITELEGMALDSEDFEQHYARLMLDVIEHAEHEEHEEFDGLSNDFTESQLAKVNKGAVIASGGLDEIKGDSFSDMLEAAKAAIS